MTRGLFLLLCVGLGCAAGAMSGGLDGVYPPGADRAAGARNTPRQQNELARTRLRDPQTGELALGDELPEALDAAISNAAGYDAYNARVKRGQGYAATWRAYCDFVFFSESQEIVASYRRRGRC